MISILNRNNILFVSIEAIACVQSTLNQSMTDATLQSTPINVTNWCNVIRKGTVEHANKNLQQNYTFIFNI